LHCNNSQSILRSQLHEGFVTMSLASLTSVFSIESENLPTPPRAHSKNSTREVHQLETDASVDIEMLPISTLKRSRDKNLSSSSSKVNIASRTSKEADPHSSPLPPGNASEQIQTIWNPYKNRFRVMACCMTAFGNGANDSAPGALIASLER
jgi:hypothetical protein